MLWVLLAAAPLYGQNYGSPVDIPVILSGNVGEVRSNHFHSGIDIKTQGEIGKNILSVADGYVARIVVSPTGYGKALYVNHPDGTTSVYGHLDRFEGAIGDYVREEQYRRKSFAVDLAPPAGRFPVKRGERIAYSGNSGSSAGPHLHFEIRHQGSQDPYNVLSRGMMKVQDNIPPEIFRFWLIEVDTVKNTPVHRVVKEYVPIKTDGRYRLENHLPVYLNGPAYFAIEMIDRKNHADNILGTYAMTVEFDGETIFSYAIDRISFATTRYINAFVYYPLHRQSRYEVVRTYVAPNNKLPVYKRTVNRGVISLKDEEEHPVRITLTDDNRNESVLEFSVQRGLERKPDFRETDGIPVWWARGITHKHEDLMVNIPLDALYESILLDIRTLPKRKAYSSFYRIHDTDTPMQKAMTITIRPDSLPARLQSKACLASISARGNRVYEGGAYKNGVVTGTSRTFGDYYVDVDTLPPVITAGFVEGADFTQKNTMTLHLSDDFSGIASWNVFIDGQWALFDYDPKNNALVHEFRYARYDMGKNHSLVAEAVDNKGNKALFRTSFKR